jgi:hypothetical protein
MKVHNEAVRPFLTAYDKMESQREREREVVSIIVEGETHTPDCDFGCVSTSRITWKGREENRIL